MERAPACELARKGRSLAGAPQAAPAAAPLAPCMQHGSVRQLRIAIWHDKKNSKTLLPQQSGCKKEDLATCANNANAQAAAAIIWT